jgi:hypothetical protein
MNGFEKKKKKRIQTFFSPSFYSHLFIVSFFSVLKPPFLCTKKRDSELKSYHLVLVI